MEKKEEEGNALLINGEDMLVRCGEGQARQLRSNLDKLKEKMYDTREKAERKRLIVKSYLFAFKYAVNVPDLVDCWNKILHFKDP